MVCRLKKELYGLKKDPRDWYARLEEYLLQHGFKKGTINSNLYFKVEEDKNLIVVVYVDDTIFGGDDSVCRRFAKDMQKNLRCL